MVTVSFMKLTGVETRKTISQGITFDVLCASYMYIYILYIRYNGGRYIFIR